MTQTSNSTMEITMKETKEHRSKVTSRGRRKSSKRTSSRLRSAKKRQDAPKKIKVFRKKLQKNQKAKKEKKQKEEEEPSSILTFTNLLSNSINQKTKKQKKEEEPSSILTFTNLSSNSIQILDLKPSKKQAKKDKEEQNTSESITTSYIHPKEKKKEKETKNLQHSNDTISFLDDSVIEVLNQSKHQDGSSHDDCTATQDNLPTNGTLTGTFENTMSAFDFLFSSVPSIHTDASAASTDSIMSTADINEPHAEATKDEAEATQDDADDKPKKKCICWPIIAAIGGFIILVAIYFGGPKLLEYKCRNEIGLYVKNLSIEKNYSPVQTYLESFNQQISDTKCTWLSKDEVNTVFEKKIEEKIKYKIDKFFESFVKTMTTDPASFSKTEFFKIQKFYEEQIKCDSLTKYYQDKKSELETNKDLIPAVVIVSDIDGFSSLNTTYELDGFDGKIPRYKGYYFDHPFSFIREDDQWKIRSSKGHGSIVNWENSANVAHPGKLGANKPVESGNKKSKDDTEIKTELFPKKKFFM